MPLLAAGILCVAGIACTAIFGRGPAVTHTAATPPPAPVHHTTIITSNPHLHIAPTPAPDFAFDGHFFSNLPKLGTHTIHVIPPVQIAHKTWTPVWDAQRYIAVHRGLATIHGVTHDAMGKPVANVRLALQHPGGRPFANAALKHITFSAANGSFTMTNVRPGTYRIYASR